VFIYHVSGQCNKTITTVGGPGAKETICAGSLIFEDNFDWFDKGKWQQEKTLYGGGNWEFQWYDDSAKNSYVQNGILHIKPTLVADEYGEDFLYSGTIDIPKDQCTEWEPQGCHRTGTPTNILNPVKSARLRTINSFSFKYGRVEARAKLPAGDWLWPAIWMLPTASKYGNWPRSGEIDIMESRGNRDLRNGGAQIGVQQSASTLHWGPDPAHNKFMSTHYEKNFNQGLNQAFHRYQVEWTPEHIKFSIDDVQIGIVTPPAGGFWQLGNLDQTGQPNPWTNSKMAPFDQDFHLIINLAIGGTSGYWPDNVGGKPWTDASGVAYTQFWQGRNQWLNSWKMNTDESHLQVDYVRVWAL